MYWASCTECSSCFGKAAAARFAGFVIESPRLTWFVILADEQELRLFWPGLVFRVRCHSYKYEQGV